MNNDRRTFLDGSTAPRKPLPAPLTEGATKATKGGKIVKKEKPKNAKGSKQTKKPYFMDYPNKYEEVTTEAKDTARAKHNAAILKAAGVKTINQLMAKKVKRPILDREISEFVERLSAKQIILLKKLIAARIAAAAELLRGNRGGYQGGNQIGNDYPGQYGNQGGNQIGNY